MTRDLLWRGMLAGILAALAAMLFARAFAEPQVDLAIAFEAAHASHHDMASAADEGELVSRATRKGLGLGTALILYGAAVGGLFSLVFAYGYGRMSRQGPRAYALLLGVFAFVAIALVPAIKYPATPPAVGQHETVALRTIAYFGMIGVSLIALVLAIRLKPLLDRWLDGFGSLIGATLAYVAIIAVAQFGLPPINEVPTDFPATLLWDFRIASLGTQLVLWAVLSLSFGAMARRRLLGGR